MFRGKFGVALGQSGFANRDLEHITETDLDDWPFKHVIQNDGTIEELRLRLADVIHWRDLATREERQDFEDVD